jgi:hypothetical protein
MSTLRELKNKQGFSAFLYQLDTELQQHSSALSPGRQSLSNMVARALGARSYEAMSHQYFNPKNTHTGTENALTQHHLPTFTYLFTQENPDTSAGDRSRLEAHLAHDGFIMWETGNTLRAEAEIMTDIQGEGRATINVELHVDWEARDAVLNFGHNTGTGETDYYLGMAIDLKTPDLVAKLSRATQASIENDDYAFHNIMLKNTNAKLKLDKLVGKLSTLLFQPAILLYPELGYHDTASNLLRHIQEYGVVSTGDSHPVPLFEFKGRPSPVNSHLNKLVATAMLEKDVSTQWAYRPLNAVKGDLLDMHQYCEQFNELFGSQCEFDITPLLEIMSDFVADSLLTAEALQTKYKSINVQTLVELPYTDFTVKDCVEQGWTPDTYWTWCTESMAAFWRNTPIFQA